MSITTTEPEPKDEKFAEVVYSADAPEPEKTEQPQAEEKEPATKPGAKKTDYLTDILMVSVLVLILGAGGYFIKTQTDKYEVPSAYEEAVAEYQQLTNEWNQLISNKKKTSTVQRVKQLQTRIDALDKQLAEAATALNKAKEKKASICSAIAQEKQAIDGARYTLREADRDYRAKALAELPGMPIGDVLNRRRNHIVKNAVVTHLDANAKIIKLRSSSDLVTWHFKDLAKKELAPIVRYALGMADFVDMSVLNEEGQAAAPKRPVIKREQAATAQEPAQDYDPAPGAPVISSGKSETISADPAVSPDAAPADVPTWDAPTGDLPI